MKRGPVPGDAGKEPDRLADKPRKTPVFRSLHQLEETLLAQMLKIGIGGFLQARHLCERVPAAVAAIGHALHAEHALRLVFQRKSKHRFDP